MITKGRLLASLLETGAIYQSQDAVIENLQRGYGDRGRVAVDGIAWSLGAFFGVLVSPTKWLRLGVGYHTNAGRMTVPATVSIDSTASTR